MKSGSSALALTKKAVCAYRARQRWLNATLRCPARPGKARRVRLRSRRNALCARNAPTDLSVSTGLIAATGGTALTEVTGAIAVSVSNAEIVATDQTAV